MDDVLLSLLIHNMNRTYDLKKSMSSIIKSVNASPPVEILILNYSSKDDLDTYIKEINKIELADGNFISYYKVEGRKYYNSPNARNIAQLRSKGEYGIQWACDSYPREDFFKVIRDLINKEHPVWMTEGYLGRALVCTKKEFINAGGYDERFIMYGPEDRDICMRLHRRGGKFIQFPQDLLYDEPTPISVKKANLENKEMRLMDMVGKMHEIYEENNKLGILEANKDAGWGFVDG